ncbi:5081_t:CDS:2, partial [Gigaspora rosea]
NHFLGHSVFPSIYLKMREPDKFTKIVNVSYTFSIIIYILTAVCGYLMFGNLAEPEITQNIMSMSNHLQILNQSIVWLVAISLFGKFPLVLDPVNLYIETHYLSKVNKWICPHYDCPLFIRFLSRMLISIIVVLISIKFPNFDRIMELIGSFSLYAVSLIFPCLFYLKLYSNNLRWWEWLINLLIILVCAILAILGTIWAFLQN